MNVAEAVSTLQIANADVATTFNTAMVENLPNPGGDITYLAQTAPGVVMNAQAGYGNFVADGMPGISNLFSINGANFNDPFFGTNTAAHPTSCWDRTTLPRPRSSTTPIRRNTVSMRARR